MDDIFSLIAEEYLDPLSRGCLLLAFGRRASAVRVLACELEDKEMKSVYTLDNLEVFRLCARPLDLIAALRARAENILLDFDVFHTAEVRYYLNPEWRVRWKDLMHTKCLPHYDRRVLSEIVETQNNKIIAHMHRRFVRSFGEDYDKKRLLQFYASVPCVPADAPWLDDLWKMSREDAAVVCQVAQPAVYDRLVAQHGFEFEVTMDSLGMLAETDYLAKIQEAATRVYLRQKQYARILHRAPQGGVVEEWAVLQIGKNRGWWPALRAKILESPRATAIARARTEIFDNFFTTEALLISAARAATPETFTYILANTKRRPVANECRLRTTLLDGIRNSENAVILMRARGECCGDCTERAWTYAISNDNAALIALLVEMRPSNSVSATTLEDAVQENSTGVALFCLQKLSLSATRARSTLIAAAERSAEQSWEAFSAVLEKLGSKFDGALADELNSLGEVLLFSLLRNVRQIWRDGYWPHLTVSWHEFGRHIVQHGTLDQMRWFFGETAEGCAVDRTTCWEENYVLAGRSSKERLYLRNGDLRRLGHMGMFTSFTADYADMNRAFGLGGQVCVIASPLLQAVRIGFWSGTVQGLRNESVRNYGADVAVWTWVFEDPESVAEAARTMFAASRIGGELFRKEGYAEILSWLNEQ